MEQTLTNKHLFYQTAAKKIKQCDYVVILAGAGMSVDSGLEPFHGKDGLQNQLEKLNLGIDYKELITQEFLDKCPEKWWYFYGKRYLKYMAAEPHRGYNLLKEICEKQFKDKYFINTSNIDELFIKSGYSQERFLESRGTLFHMQCNRCQIIYEEKSLQFTFDDEKMETNDVPRCKQCNGVLRPNNFLYRDETYIFQRQHSQTEKYKEFLDECEKGQRVLILEIGAGTVFPTIRLESERLMKRFSAQKSVMIRINIEKQSVIEIRESDTNVITEDNITDVNDDDISSSKYTIFEVNDHALASLIDIHSAFENIQQ